MGVTSTTGISENDVGSFSSVKVTGTVSANKLEVTATAQASRFIGVGAPIAMARVSCQAGTINPEIKVSYNIASVSAIAAGSYVFTLQTPAADVNNMIPTATAVQVADQGPRTCQIRFLSTSLIHVQVFASSGFSTPSGITMICF